jgi:hypothetical protein
MNSRKLSGPLTGGGRFALLLLVACADDTTNLTDPGLTSVLDHQCIIPQNLIFDAGPGKDGVRALTDPTLVTRWDPTADYLQNGDRVLGLVTEAGPIAIPLNRPGNHPLPSDRVLLGFRPARGLGCGVRGVRASL